MAWTLSAGLIFSRAWHKIGYSFVSEKSDEVNLLKRSGEPPRTRTWNPLIKSQLLYRLS